ncbi:unnamed protein product [Aphanomyces euteiches]
MSDHKFAVHAAMAGTAVLLVKHVVTGFFGAAAKFKAGSRAPEDTPDGKQSFGVADADPKDETLKAAKLVEMRWNRITMNDLENVPIGLVTTWAAIAAGADGKIVTSPRKLFNINK